MPLTDEWTFSGAMRRHKTPDVRANPLYGTFRNFVARLIHNRCVAISVLSMNGRNRPAELEVAPVSVGQEQVDRHVADGPCSL